ncbi:MAG: MarR family transcriptional regulator [Acidimicrobiia bacterium]|nr:MarR family transcriptional regulator [Acidimicrobiia bacterium]
MASAGNSTSDARFLTHHALRIKGFAKSETLAEMTALDHAEVEKHLADLAAAEWAMFREARSLWQLTPTGKAEHPKVLAADVALVDLNSLKPHYHSFLELNTAFKTLCGDWQLRDGAPNDHSDAAYDKKVIARLVDLHGDAAPVVTSMGSVLGRLTPYVPRLSTTCQAVVAGQTNMFTGVMCGSFHDVWMELHEDLILSQGIDRAAEGSF